MANKVLEAMPDDIEAVAKGIYPGYLILVYKAKSLPISFRNMVYSKWMRSLRWGNEYFKLIDSDSYYKSYQKYLDSLFLRPDMVVRIAALVEDNDVALGFSVIENKALHYVHVQVDYRGLDIAKSLVPIEPEFITHLTKRGLSIWNAKAPKAKFQPFY